MLRDLADLLPKLTQSPGAPADTYPTGAVQSLYEADIIIAPFATHFGGESATLRDAAAAVRELASASPSLALIASMPLGLAGMYGAHIEAIPTAHRDGWNAQSEQIAANYRAHELYAACNSEKGAGGSLAATRTLATRGPDSVFRLTGEKILATSGRFATHFFSTAKVDPADLPRAGVVEFFFVSTHAPGVEILEDWDGFGMRSTESQTVRYTGALVTDLVGFPNLIEVLQPLQYWYCLFAAIPLGCAWAVLRELSIPASQSPALNLRLAEATMRLEALTAYLDQVASEWRPGAGAAYAGRVLRMKTYVTQESTKLCAELFALAGGRHYRRTSRVANLLADAFAGTALRPPLSLALETLSETFALD
ncbi:MAG TPA: acyl-CoA dehydrogenase family protein [Terriglobia bacterium]|nr:acyl-CoA dehydrogenase family protein [Terriglobia bacterium]